MKILLLEDDIILAEIISEYLIKNDFILYIAYNGEEAEELIYSEQFDLLLLDINVPNISGLSITNKIRCNGLLMPIIVITSSVCLEDLKKAYKYGADDFIRKPFSLEELLIRINYIKEKFFIESIKVVNLTNEIKFNLMTMSIQKKEEIIYLPKKEAEILKYFLFNKNRIISINELVLNIWGYDTEPSIATIRTYIKNIRKYIDKDSFKTIKGLGYILEI
jgi:DNA-binding response OmpR family regulator